MQSSHEAEVFESCREGGSRFFLPKTKPNPIIAGCLIISTILILAVTVPLRPDEINLRIPSTATMVQNEVDVATPEIIPTGSNPKYPDANEISKDSYPGYPECQARLNWLEANWNVTEANYEYYSTKGVDGSITSFLNFLNDDLYCPAAVDAEKSIIRGVCLGGWFVLEPWIVPSLFEQFQPSQGVVDQWTFCETLGKVECKRQLEQHWKTWIVEDDIRKVAEAGINHVRIPVGYWIMGDIHPNEPWVNGDLVYLQKAMYWFLKYNVSVVFDLHCAPGSQNGFDNSGHKGPIHWADPAVSDKGEVFYPNIDRTLTVLEALVSVFSLEPFNNIVRYVELVNEAFITIPIEIVKAFYIRGYEAVRNINPNIGVIIGDSFRFQAWDNFMYPPAFTHVYIDTHIYQVFDPYHLQLSQQQHIDQTCEQDLPMVAVSPLSTIVGEWCLATTDCAKWLNGYGNGARYDGTFLNVPAIGTCVGQNNINDTSVWTPEYKAFLRQYAEAQMDAYEAGSSQGWFFWTIKTEQAPQWNYLLGLEEGWIPKRLETSQRPHPCYANLPSNTQNAQSFKLNQKPTQTCTKTCTKTCTETCTTTCTENCINVADVGGS